MLRYKNDLVRAILKIICLARPAATLATFLECPTIVCFIAWSAVIWAFYSTHKQEYFTAVRSDVFAADIFLYTCDLAIYQY